LDLEVGQNFSRKHYDLGPVSPHREILILSLPKFKMQLVIGYSLVRLKQSRP